MTNPQSGVLSADGPARYFLEYRLRQGIDAGALRGALGAALTENSEVETVVAFGPSAIDLLELGVECQPFETIQGAGQSAGHSAPSTQRDIWIWVHGAGHDAVFDRVAHVHRSLAAVAQVELELRGFDYRNSHDLIGFEDGTANPKGDAALAAALLPMGPPGAGGSFVLTQQWVHDLEAFAALPVEEQERIIGRTKADSIEFEGDAMAEDSHVSRTDAKVDGTAMKILRHSSPYGSATEHGLYFVAFACEQRRFQVQLERMFGVAGDGLSDRLIQFSRAITGSYWFAPSADAMRELLL